MLAHELKQYIIDNNLLTLLLEKMELHNIKEKVTSSGVWVFCSWKDGDNPGAIQIKKDTLYVKTYTHTNISGDIFALTGYIYNVGFFDSLKKIHVMLGVPFCKTYSPAKDIKKIDILEPLKKYRKNSNSNIFITKTYPLSALSAFKKINWINWVKEGISNPVAKEFLICYDDATERMVLPYRSVDINGEALVGATGRTLLSHEVCKEFGIPKYMCMPGLEFKKTQTLYGYVENYNSVISKGEVVLGESEKMVLQRASLYDRAVMSVGGHCISNKQKQLLIGLNVDVIIAFDKDIKEEQIWEECEKFNANIGGFNMVRNVYYIYDRENLLGEKDAPVDKGDKIYHILYNQKIKYTRDIHDKYLEIKKDIPSHNNSDYFTGDINEI